MKILNKIRGKSDTKFHCDKLYLDSIHYNLKILQMNTPLSTHPKFTKGTINQIQKHKKFRNLRAKEPQTEESEIFNSLVIKTIWIMHQLDRSLLFGLFHSQKLYLNTMLTLFRAKIKLFRDKLIATYANNHVYTEWIEKIGNFDEVVKALINIKPEEYYKEWKTFIWNEFEKSKNEVNNVFEIIKSNSNKSTLVEDWTSCNSVNNMNILSGSTYTHSPEVSISSTERDFVSSESIDPSVFIDSISKNILFLISEISFNWDYYSLTMNCWIQRLKTYTIKYIEVHLSLNSKYISPLTRRKRVNTLQLINQLIFWSKVFSREFYMDHDSNIEIMNNSSSYGRYILSNFVQVLAKSDAIIALPKEEPIGFQKSIPNNMQIWKNYANKMTKELGDIGNIRWEKFFELFFNLKLVFWKNNSVKIENAKKKTMICRICEQCIPVNDFIFHINYCKEQKAFYSELRKCKEQLSIALNKWEEFKTKSLLSTEKTKNEIFSQTSTLLKEIQKIKYINTPDEFVLEKLSDKNINSAETIKYVYNTFIKIYSFEMSMEVDYYEKNPEKLYWLNSWIYFTNYIFYSNQKSNLLSPELNEIFSTFFTNWLKKEVAIEYIMTINKSKTNSNSLKNHPWLVKKQSNGPKRDSNSKWNEWYKSNNSSLLVRDRKEAKLSEESLSTSNWDKKHSSAELVKSYSVNHVEFPKKLKTLKNKLSINNWANSPARSFRSQSKKRKQRSPKVKAKTILIKNHEQIIHLKMWVHSNTWSKPKRMSIMGERADKWEGIKDDNWSRKDDSLEGSDYEIDDFDQDDSNSQWMFWSNRKVSNFSFLSNKSTSIWCFNNKNKKPNITNGITFKGEAINTRDESSFEVNNAKKENMNKKLRVPENSQLFIRQNHNRTVSEKIQTGHSLLKLWAKDNESDAVKVRPAKKSWFGNQFQISGFWEINDQSLKGKVPHQVKDNSSNKDIYFNSDEKDEFAEGEGNIILEDQGNSISHDNSISNEIDNVFFYQRGNEKGNLHNEENEKDKEEEGEEEDKDKENKGDDKKANVNVNNENYKEEHVNLEDNEDENLNNDDHEYIEDNDIEHLNLEDNEDENLNNDDTEVDNLKPEDFGHENLTKNGIKQLRKPSRVISSKQWKISIWSSSDDSNFEDEIWIEDEAEKEEDSEYKIMNEVWIEWWDNINANSAASPKKGSCDDPSEVSNSDFILNSWGSTVLKHKESKERCSVELLRPEQSSILSFEHVVSLSKGGYGRVDLYKKKSTGDFFAIKIVNINNIIEKKLSSSLKNETIILNEINSDYVVKCYYIFQDEVNYYYVMEYMPGGDVFDLMDQYDCPNSTIQLIIAEVLLSIVYLHSINIIHHDIKPNNILLGSDGHFKLTDFGLSESNSCKNRYAIFYSNNSTFDLNINEQEEENKQIVGTLNYLAPESFDEETKASNSVDYWALGVLIFELYSGLVPFYAETFKETRDKIINMKINWSPLEEDKIKELYPNIDIVRDLIEKFLRKNPEDRWGDRNIEDIKRHKFFDGFNWARIKDIKDKTVWYFLKQKIEKMNTVIKEANTNKKNVPTLPSKLSTVFYCERVDNLFSKCQDWIKGKFKRREISISEKAQDTLLDDWI